MSQKTPACIQCGGTDYILESGFYFCSECQVQSQEIREEVFDDYWSCQRSGRVSIAAPVSQEVVTQESSVQLPVISDKSFTSWEVLNIVLKGLVDELIILGAPKELKLVVLQLWASYLMKTEVAFLSKQIEKRPRLGLNFRKRDAQLVYGTNNDLIKVYKRPIYRKKRERQSVKSSDQASTTSVTNKRIEKYRLTMKKKMLAKAEYEQSLVSSQVSEITLESLSGKSASSSKKSYKLRYNKKAKVALSSMLDAASEIDNDARGSLQKKVLVRDAKSVEHISLSKVLAILRLALLILDVDIQLGDILRWSEEGYLSLLNAEKLLPTGASTGKDVMALFVSNLNSRSCINRNVIQMAELLRITDVSHRILPLIERYLKELQLPYDLFTVIKMFIELCPPKLKLTASVNYEGRAMAYIIFTLKFFFGLDGITEKRISKTAKAINRKQDSNKRLFVWSEWVRYINCRSSVISTYHQATREQHHPTSSIGGSKPFLSHWEKSPSRHTLQRRHIISPNVKDCIRRFLKEFTQELVEPLPPSLTPHTSLLMEIFDRDLHIPDRAKRILQQEFQNDSIDYMYDPVVQQEFFAKYGVEYEKCLAAKVVQVKPFILEGNSVKPSLKGNKEFIVVKIDCKEGKSEKRKTSKNPEVDMKRGFLPDPNEILHGVKLKDRSESVEDALSICGRKYWVYHGAFSNVRTELSFFNYIAECVFPTDFLWLLKETSLIAHVCSRDLYTQLSYVEKMYLEYLTKKKKPRKFFINHW